MTHVSIRINILTHFILLILFSAFLLLSVQYYFNTQSAMEAGEKNFHELFERVEYRNVSLNQQNEAILNLLQHHPDLQDGMVDASKLLPLFSQSLTQFPKAYAIYLATADNEFYEVVNMAYSETLQKRLQAPSGTAWTVVQVYPDREQENYHFRYYDLQLQLLSERVSSTIYSSSQRPWYKNALTSKDVHQSKPYLFWHLKAPGVTFSKQINASTVLAIDYTIEHLTDLFERLKPTVDSQIVLFNQFGEKYFETDVRSEFLELNQQGFELTQKEREYISNLPVLKVSNQENWEPFDFVQNGHANGFSIELLRSLAKTLGLKIQFVNGYTWDEILEEFRHGRIDLVHSLLHSPEREQLGIFSKTYYSIDNYLITQEKIGTIQTVEDLKFLRFALGKGWQSTELLLREFPGLSYTLYDDLPAMMRAVNAGEADVLIDNADTFARSRQKHQFKNIKLNQKLQKFIPKQEHLHFFVREEYAPLVAILNRALDAIDPESIKDLAQKWYLGASLKNLKISPYESLFYQLLHRLPAQEKAFFYKTKIEGQAYLTAVSPIEYNNDSTYLATFVPQSSLLAPYRKQLYLSFASLSISLAVILWLANFSSNLIVRPINELMKRNQLIAARRFEQVTPVETYIKELAELSDTLMQVSDSFRRYEKHQEAFLQGLVKLIAETTDKRSHHTYSHCSRVPKLGIMLLQAAVKENRGSFKHFHMSAKEEQAFELGAWLHDSGKITTPEFLLEKSTKLDAFYNRIHEIRMRFEVLWRDAEIQYLQNISEHCEPEMQRRFKQQLKETQQQLQHEFGFIAGLNIGTVEVSDKSLATLTCIASKTWQSHFDKSLGLSKFQLERMPRQTSNTESLLQDYPEQISLRDAKEFEFYAKHGFNMNVPAHEQNLGERYNLSIERGTLTAEERFRMEEHVVMTLKLLEQVPLPKQYKNIPKYAGTHHEKLDGSGYPRQLTAEHLGIPERIMALADIFEALTAPDRPYKRTHKLSKALDILHGMVEDKKVDKDVFELFLRSGIYLEFAEQYIDPAQLDSVDIDKYLGA